MNDVFDEDLMKELGLDPEDLKDSTSTKKKRPISQTPEASQPKQSQPSQAAPAKPTPPPQKPSMPQPPKPAPKAPKPEPETLEEQASRVSQNIPVQLAAVLAKKSIKLKDILELKTGELIEFKKMPQEPLDLVANGKLIAKADLVLIDGKIGARIVKLVK